MITRLGVKNKRGLLFVVAVLVLNVTLDVTLVVVQHQRVEQERRHDQELQREYVRVYRDLDCDPRLGCGYN